MGDDGGPKDRALINKVGNKLKHSSTLEHLIMCWESDDELVIRAFRENPFSKVNPSTNGQIISTNFRALQESWLPHDLKVALAPKEYKYLLGEVDLTYTEYQPCPINIGEDTATLLYNNSIEALDARLWEVEPHLYYTFYLQNTSRAVLQELARHRQASPSVKSTRYTLKELKKEPTIYKHCDHDGGMELVKKYCVLTGHEDVDHCIAMALHNLQALIKDGVPNDVAKFALPDAYKTELTWTINAQSLQNFLYLRTAPSALWAARKLAYRIYDTLPRNHWSLYADCVHPDRPEGV